MADRFIKKSTEIDSPIIDAFAVTPNDATTFSQPTRALYVGTGGNIKVMMNSYNNSNTVVTLTNVQNGAVLPIRVKRVYSGNTTATGIVGLY